LVTVITFIACNDASQPESHPGRETGTLLFNVSWPAQQALPSDRISYALFDCDGMNVDKISAHVFSDSGEQLQTGGPWECAVGSGTITKVPAGDHRTVRLCAFEPGGEEVYRGEVLNVAVQSKQAVAVDVCMEDVFSRTISMVHDFYPGPTGSFPHHLATLQDELYLVAANPNHGFELFNTVSELILHNIYPSGPLDHSGVMAPRDFVELNGRLYFFANNGTGYRLWRTAGTSATTEPLPAGADYFNPAELTVLQGKLFFSAESVGAGRELWVFDESVGRAEMFDDINAGQANSNPHELTAVGDDLFFTADDGSYGYELYRANPQEEQCSIVRDIALLTARSYPRHLTNVNGRLFFDATNGPQSSRNRTHGNEVWMAWRQGDTITTQLVADINVTSQYSGSSNPKNLTWVYGSTLAFSAYSPDTGHELYLFDWQTDEAPRLHDLNPSDGSSFPGNFVYLDGTLYFTAYNSESVEHLWAYLPDQSQPVKCLTSNAQYPTPRNLAVANRTLYFTATHDSLARRLWATDGTKTGLVVGTDGKSPPHSPVNLFAASNGRLYYSAFDKEYGEELFQLVDP
jgi:ELWxxDGT repeat protein